MGVDELMNNWFERLSVTTFVTLAGMFSACRAQDYSAEKSCYYAVAFAALSVTIHRLVLLGKKYGS